MKEMKIFENKEFGKVRTVVIDNEPWFVGKDVAESLGYQNGSRDINTHVSEEDRKILTAQNYQNGTFEIPNRGLTIINESGLYALIFGSKLKSARRFKHWVTSEILPSIRKHGGYIAGQESMSDEELLSRALLMAQSKIEERDQIIQKQDRQIQVMKPKAKFHDAVTDSQNTISFGNFAAALNRNGLHLSRTQLFKYCRYKGYLCDAPDVHNKPTQQMINKGYMVYDKYVQHYKRKRWETSHTPKLTGKGQVWLTDRILSDYNQNPEHFMNMCNY